MDRSRLRANLAELARRRAASPLDYVRWLVPQHAWLCMSGDKLYRAGNQALGKSTAGLAEVIWRCLGTHPHYPTKPPPIEVIVCSLNQAQSISIQAKFHALLPADCLADGCVYNEKTGYGANRPMTRFACGSTIRWVTDDQGPRSCAGATVDVVLVDEPCSPEMMRELRKRILVKAGVLLATLTPINGPVEHIHEDVDRGIIPEVHAPLTVANLRHVDTGEIRTLEDGTLCDSAWIAEMWRKEPKSWAGITLDGLWEVRSEGAIFGPVWDPAVHVSDTARLSGTSIWSIGIDYATADRDHGLVATLVNVETSRDASGRLTESIIIEDMVSLPGTATVSLFATDILAMLTRNNLRWRDLRTVYGDNPVTSSTEYRGNADLSRRIAMELKVTAQGLSPRILSAKERTSGGSRDTGVRWLYAAMAENRIVVRKRCQPMIEAIESWDGTATSVFKDRVDSVRYSCRDFIFPLGRSNTVTVRFA